MQCPSCGAAVVPEQKFCHECGALLRGITETTQEVDVVEPDTVASSAVTHDAKSMHSKKALEFEISI